LKPYEILATGPNCGIIECVSDTQSLDEIHKLREEYMTLAEYF
jgi:phosphatidylinositol kinase/protein kinase (PI-3  family)